MSHITGKSSFTMHAGDTKYVRIFIFKDDGVTPLPLEGAKITWTVARYESVILEKSTDAETVSITDAPNGAIMIELKPQDTACLFGEYYHKCYVIDQNGIASTVLTGEIQIM